MRLGFLIALTSFLTLGAVSSAQVPVDFSPRSVSTRPVAYEAISSVSEGPAHSFADGKVRGKFQRVIVLNLGLVYDRPTLRLETLSYGDEACCRRVIEAWELKIDDLSRSSILLPDAATSELRFVRWRDSRTAEFRYGDFACRFQGIGRPKLTISCAK